jgi:hypothetical protein
MKEKMTEKERQAAHKFTHDAEKIRKITDIQLTKNWQPSQAIDTLREICKECPATTISCKKCILQDTAYNIYNYRNTELMKKEWIKTKKESKVQGTSSEPKKPNVHY